MQFAERLKELRLEKGLSQLELAEQTGYTQATVSLWESAEREPLATAILTLAKYFHCSTDFLLGRTDEWGNVDNLSELLADEQQLLMLYRKVDLKDKEKILTALEVLASVKMK